MNEASTLIHALNDMWNSQDIDRLASLYAPDVEHEDVTSGVKLHGHSELRKLFLEAWEGMPDVRTKIGRIISQDNRLAWEWTMSATHAGDFPNLPATGRTFTIEGVSILEVKDGLVRSQRDFYDQASFLRQVGALPEGM